MDLNQQKMKMLSEVNEKALKDLDKANMINGAIMLAISAKGSLTLAEYNTIYGQTLAEWQAKHAAPNN